MVVHLTPHVVLHYASTSNWRGVLRTLGSLVIQSSFTLWIFVFADPVQIWALNMFKTLLVMTLEIPRYKYPILPSRSLHYEMASATRSYLIPTERKMLVTSLWHNRNYFRKDVIFRPDLNECCNKEYFLKHQINPKTCQQYYVWK